MRYSYERIKTKTPTTSSNAGTTQRTLRAISLASAVVVSALYLGLMPAEAVTCKQVRGWVASYGKDNVAAYAKWQGWPQRRIDRIARVCRL